jgi:hypothetical protein
VILHYCLFFLPIIKSNFMQEITSSATVTVQELPKAESKPAYKNPGDVEFVVKYPEGYEGPKHMPEGPVTISKESAEQFTALGIGHVAGDEAEASVASDNQSSSKVTLKADEVIAQINAAETAEAVEALIVGETRKTVLAAADARLKVLIDAQA